MATTEEIFAKALKVLRWGKFLDGSLVRPGLPIYICPYDAAREGEMRGMVANLKSRLAAKGIGVLEVDVFRLMVDILEAHGDLEFELEDEKNWDDRRDFLGHLQGLLDLGEELVPEIRRRIATERPRVLFLTGIGGAYPVVRAHALLAHLEGATGEVPTVLFFPGEYRQTPGSGATLRLFGRLPGDGYYRAHNLLDIQVPEDTE
jgi:hypothetical protein